MALTQNAWATTTSNGYNKFECTVVHTTSESDAYTLRTPSALDGSRPWVLQGHTAIAADNAALAVDVWLGFNNDFALSGDTTAVTAGSNGVRYKEIMDDARTALPTYRFAWLMDPKLPVADVVTLAAIDTGLKVRMPEAPYYSISLNGDTLIATTATWTIFQKIEGGGANTIGGVGADPS